MGSDSVDAADDGEAVALAKARSDGRTVELWDATHRLRVIGPFAAAGMPRD